MALGAGLRSSGHDVVLGASAAYAELVTDSGLRFAPLEGDTMAILSSARGQAWTRSGRNAIRFLGTMRTLLEPLADQLLADAVDACRGADAIVYTPLSPAGSHIAEAARVPGLVASVRPLTATAEFPAATLGGLPSLGGVGNRLTYSLLTAATVVLRSITNRWRRSLELPPLGWRNPYGALADPRQTFLYGYSERVVPRPHDWNDCQHVTGYWFAQRPADWRPAQGLVDYLASGEAPVAVTFGSMTYAAETATDAVLEALARSGHRAVLIGPGCGNRPARLGGSVFTAEDVPHDWLFPQMTAVVHHGGAGTTAAVLRAGVPGVVVPFFMDQPFWGRRMAGLGVSPPPVPRKKASADRLGAALRVATGDDTMRRRSARLAEQIRAEDGVATAVATIDRLLGTILVA